MVAKATMSGVSSGAESVAAEAVDEGSGADGKDIVVDSK